MNQHGLAFFASTGRTATMFVARTLNALDGVVALHEGHNTAEPPIPQLSLINLHNRQAWYDRNFADQTVAELRSQAALTKAAAGAEILADVAFYNAPLLPSLAQQHPTATLFVIARRCEGFVRSATLVSGEDLQPAGWPDRAKPLSEREQFIALGRLQPHPDSEEAQIWKDWSAIQRNVWLWGTVNEHLLNVAGSLPNCHVLHYEDLQSRPAKFWRTVLEQFGLLTDAHLEQCVERSMTPVNSRPGYQTGTLDSWSPVEQELYQRIALPLEKRIYD